MNLRSLVGKQIDYDRLENDIERGGLRGVHSHKKGSYHDEFEVLEVVVGRDPEHVYALKVYLADHVIKKIQRVKFQAMCGGWRGKDRTIGAFPPHIPDGPRAAEMLFSYKL